MQLLLPASVNGSTRLTPPLRFMYLARMGSMCQPLDRRILTPGGQRSRHVQRLLKHPHECRQVALIVTGDIGTQPSSRLAVRKSPTPPDRQAKCSDRSEPCRSIELTGGRSRPAPASDPPPPTPLSSGRRVDFELSRCPPRLTENKSARFCEISAGTGPEDSRGVVNAAEVRLNWEQRTALNQAVTGIPR